MDDQAHSEKVKIYKKQMQLRILTYLGLVMTDSSSEGRSFESSG